MQVSATGYLEQLIDPNSRKDTIDKAVEYLRNIEKDYPFDAIAFTGMSGALIGVPVADILGKGLIAVRRKDDKSNHSGRAVEGVKASRYVIIDDLIATGATLFHVRDSIKWWHPEASLVGVYLYYSKPFNKTPIYDYRIWGKGEDESFPVFAETY